MAVDIWNIILKSTAVEAGLWDDMIYVKVH